MTEENTAGELKLHEFCMLKHELEANIMASIQLHIDEFEQKTNLTPEYISISLGKVTELNQRYGKHYVESVNTDIKLVFKNETP